jgi:diguanylate cyclase (GGDEF)-like protein/PAS domain S-box-containing protein
VSDPVIHPLLARQLRRLGIATDAGPPPAGSWASLLARVSRAYEDHDQERYLLERSQDLASKEMSDLYGALRTERDLLDTRVRERTDALRLSEARLTSLLSLSADWIWEHDEQMRFTYFSEGIEAAVGIPAQMLIGRRRLADDAFDAPEDARAAHAECIQARRAFRDFTYGFVRPDGVRRYIRISGEPVFDETGRYRGYRGVGRDVTQAALAEQKVQELARYDSLTGLPNRNTFLIELDQALARSRRQGTEFAACFIDLDRFKSINDSLGHEAGDQLLTLMAMRLRGALRETDLVARLGGDEFVVLIEQGGSPANLSRIAQKLLTAIAEPVTLEGSNFQVTGSLGIALSPRDGDDAATLLRHADAAMYLAKERGKNNLQFFTAELAEESARQFALESELRLALARDELLLHYQPKIDLVSGRMAGVEALLRWQHPSRGLVGPGEFIGLAEDRGLIVPLGRWVMQAACRQIQAWRQAGLGVAPVAVNLSARQFAHDALVGDLQDAMHRYGVSPAELEVELTESALMADPDRASDVLHRLADLGMRIAIDDFGTGYSSLSYLKRFPAQTVKIDRSFICGLPGDADDAAITQAVIAMAHSLGLKVVAEGVETDLQLQMLQRIGCDEAQGYLLGRPMPAIDLSARLPRVSDCRDAA